MPLTVATAELAGTLFECACYGMYLLVFFQCLKVFYRRYHDGRKVWYLLATAFVMFGLITVHLVLDLTRVVDAFTDHTDVPNGADIYYAGTDTPVPIAKTTTYVILTLVSDVVFVYRIFVMWGRNYFVASVPFAIWAADVALGVWSLQIFVKPGDTPVDLAILLRFLNFYILTLVLNVLCTLMISWKIWSVHRRVEGQAVAGIRVYGIMAVIIESAAVYSGLLVYLIVTTVRASPALWIVLDSIAPLIGMIFSAMLVRASKEYHTDTFLTHDVTLPSPLDARAASCATLPEPARGWLWPGGPPPPPRRTLYI
ncbi:hypothetical protein PHLGIDRAFT_129530 [Phlebiopsis gigantea 11061_1 CR5-6]|uniref:THH1/TOM1/TOM3 domain-containing protein n=1 Tax=Phlebiopsis gigantea (strain 11061_1 CR5-6) TaxID=745531 RepID=A0A0C3S3G1_PHLG1|nr:hypothetical protein PHLGIDRAFT_129530 [Phlebiopsis gigantea 11061_1 CR5-6]